jgi:hypothetical protein
MAGLGKVGSAYLAFVVSGALAACGLYTPDKDPFTSNAPVALATFLTRFQHKDTSVKRASIVFVIIFGFVSRICGRCKVAEMRRRHLLAHHRLEIEHVDDVFRVRDQVVGVQRRPYQRIGKPGLGQQGLGEGAHVRIGKRSRGGDEF